MNRVNILFWISLQIISAIFQRRGRNKNILKYGMLLHLNTVMTLIAGMNRVDGTQKQ